jgi:hypothetical protein
VLWEWLRLSKSSNARAALHTQSGITFHPKVLLVEGTYSFAIVGSGNLSRGGLIDNVECGVFVDSLPMLNELRTWFDDLFRTAELLRDAIVLDYEKKWRLLRKSAIDLRNQQKGLEAEFAAKNAALMGRWEDAVASAKRYLNSAKFSKTYDGRKAGGLGIKAALNYPAFNFDERGWKEFYGIQELGHLIPLYRDRVLKKKALLQDSFRQLTGEEAQVPNALEKLFSRGGKFRIKGLGLNVVSKILAVHAPAKWAVYNGPVDKALRSFGYVPPRGASLAAKYIAYTRMMEEFKSATGLPDAYALDAFFYDVHLNLAKN